MAVPFSVAVSAACTGSVLMPVHGAPAGTRGWRVVDPRLAPAIPQRREMGAGDFDRVPSSAVEGCSQLADRSAYAAVAMSAVQYLHLVASTAIISAQRGHFFVGGAGASLISAFVIK